MDEPVDEESWFRKEGGFVDDDDDALTFPNKIEDVRRERSGREEDEDEEEETFRLEDEDLIGVKEWRSNLRDRKGY